MRKPILILCNLFLCLTLFGQTQNRVTGTVTSSDGGNVSASILIKGTKLGTSSDAGGKYSIDNVPANAVLIFSSVGYKNLEVPVNNRNIVNANLEADAQALDEVIMVAYGTATKGTFTGSASVIDGDDLKEMPATSFQNALIGKAPGVSVTSSSGQAGSTTSIQIRGIGSMSASTQPLYVIDGVPVISGSTGQLNDYINTTNNVLNSLNPADIESISILKDAAASSLYGSRAANGVVLVTTKRGKSGKPKITLSSSIGFTPEYATDNYEVANTQENVDFLYKVFHDYNTSAGKTDAVASADALRRLNVKFNKHGYTFKTDGTALTDKVNIIGLTDGLVNREGNYFDWEDALFRTGIFQTNDISVSGGDQNTKYYSSLSYTKDQSRVKINEFDRVTGRVNLSQKIGKNIEFITNINVAKNSLSGYNDSRNTSSNYYMQSRNLLWGLYHPTDYKTGKDWTARFGSLAQNNLYYDKEWENSSNTLKLTANETLIINILPELNIRSVFSYDNTQTKDHIYYSRDHYNGLSLGTVTEMTENTYKVVSSTTLNYEKSFGKHGLGLLAGFEAEKLETDFMRSSGKDLPASGLHTVATAGVKDAQAYYWGNTMMSVLSRIEYNYNQKYYASASYRRDGSSRLSPEARWGDFYSVAGAWRIDKEAFMQDVDFISNLRLRASYGVNGTLPVGNNAWRGLTGYDSKYMEQAGGTLNSISNEKLSWETNYTSNIALEFGFLNNRIYGSVEYFNRDSRDLLQNVPISQVTGFSSTMRNIGSINNNGIELSIGGDIIRNNNIRWSANLNGSFVNSKVTKLSDGADIIWYDPTGGDARAQFIYREGESTLAFYGYEYAGVDPANGKSRYFVNKAGDKTAGDFQLDGRGATYDFKKANFAIIGDAMPKVYGGVSTDVEYKGFTLGLNFIYKIGGDLYDGAEKDVADDGYYWERTRSKIQYEDAWTAENPKGVLPKLSGNDLTDAIQYSSRHLYNAGFARLKNITLGYNFPKSFIGKAGISSTRVFFTGSNLLTVSKYKVADPEVNQFGTRGWETPIGKTYTFGIELSF